VVVADRASINKTALQRATLGDNNLEPVCHSGLPEKRWAGHWSHAAAGIPMRKQRMVELQSKRVLRSEAWRR